MEKDAPAIQCKPLKRKLDEAELSEESATPPSPGFQEGTEPVSLSPHQRDLKPSVTCPQVVVASRLQDLDIQSPVTAHPAPYTARSEKEDTEPRSQDKEWQIKIQEHSIEPSAASSDTSTPGEDHGFPGGAGIMIESSLSLTGNDLQTTDSEDRGSHFPSHNDETTDPFEDSLTWDDSEITGHHATDPNDDGYGLNGIGFKPSAEVAWARSQRRKDQVAEWERREAIEAREARIRKRQSRGGTDSGVTTPTGGPKQKRVKFEA